MVQNLSQKPTASAQDFCERYPIEKTQVELTRLRRANVSSSARSLMTVDRPAQTHGPIKSVDLENVSFQWFARHLCSQLQSVFFGRSCDSLFFGRRLISECTTRAA